MELEVIAFSFQTNRLASMRQYLKTNDYRVLLKHACKNPVDEGNKLRKEFSDDSQLLYTDLRIKVTCRGVIPRISLMEVINQPL